MLNDIAGKLKYRILCVTLLKTVFSVVKFTPQFLCGSIWYETTWEHWGLFQKTLLPPKDAVNGLHGTCISLVVTIPSLSFCCRRWHLCRANVSVIILLPETLWSGKTTPVPFPDYHLQGEAESVT